MLMVVIKSHLLVYDHSFLVHWPSARYPNYYICIHGTYISSGSLTLIIFAYEKENRVIKSIA